MYTLWQGEYLVFLFEKKKKVKSEIKQSLVWLLSLASCAVEQESHTCPDWMLTQRETFKVGGIMEVYFMKHTPYSS